MSNVKVSTLVLDLEHPIQLDYSDFDAVFITAGVSLASDDLQTLSIDHSSERLRRIVGVNFMGPARIMLDAFSMFKLRKTKTYIGVCSSIAAPVPRSRNLIYAAAKNGLESLVQSLQHGATGTAVTVQCFRLGYVDTSLSYGQKLLFPALMPEDVAKKIIESSVCRSKRFIYVPGYWRFIVMILKSLPWAIYTKLKF
jgi:short-subunit dehydrogenase